MKKIPLFVLSVLFLMGATDDKNNGSFSWLKTIHVDNIYLFGEVKVLYNPNLTTLIERNEKEGDEVSSMLIMRTRLDSSSEDIYEISFFEGHALDPTFTIEKFVDGKSTMIRDIQATTLVVPGNGYVYSSGHVFSRYEGKSKYKVHEYSIVEVKQPFYYVGVKGKANIDINIYSEKVGGELVAHLPKGSQFEVLLNSRQYFLIKTNFGLVGWFEYTSDNPYDTPIEGLQMYAQ